MKVIQQQLPREINHSFIFYEEILPFPAYHYHPEFELAYILEGRGTLLVGDYVGCFRENDLVFIGPYLPHEHRCDPHYLKADGEFSGRALVIQFNSDFLGKDFFLAPENRELSRFLDNSSRGCHLTGRDKHQIVNCMVDMKAGSHHKRLYLLMEIFSVLSKAEALNLLASPGFADPYRNKGGGDISGALDYIIQNFQTDIKVSDILNITGMSNTRFSNEFRNVTRMSFKSYLNNVRIGYACRLLTTGDTIISEAAFMAGFANVSNFNRQFKKIKGLTPKEYVMKNRKKTEGQVSVYS